MVKPRSAKVDPDKNRLVSANKKIVGSTPTPRSKLRSAPMAGKILT